MLISYEYIGFLIWNIAGISAFHYFVADNVTVKGTTVTEKRTNGVMDEWALEKGSRESDIHSVPNFVSNSSL